MRPTLVGVVVASILAGSAFPDAARNAAAAVPPVPAEHLLAVIERPPLVVDDFELTDAAWVAQAHQIWLVADAARIAAETPPPPPPTPPPVRAPTTLSDAQLYRLRMCESTDNYAIDTGNGYWGAYQFDLTTWNGVASRWAPEWVGVLPSHAPPAVQDALTRALWSERGRYPWPVCGLRV